MTARRIVAPEVELRLLPHPVEWGVFAARDFAPGEVVEEAIVYVEECEFDNLPLETRKRVFHWGMLAHGEVNDDSYAIATGYAGLYNHANPANLHYEADPGDRVMRFVAARDIGAEEQLTINYSGSGGRAECCNESWGPSEGVTLINLNPASAPRGA